MQPLDRAGTWGWYFDVSSVFICFYKDSSKHSPFDLYPLNTNHNPRIYVLLLAACPQKKVSRMAL